MSSTVCKRRYKTVASLKAHTTQYHGRDLSASSSPVPQPVISLAAPTPAVPAAPSLTSTPAVSAGISAPVQPTPDEKVPIFLAPPPSLQVRQRVSRPSVYWGY